MKNKKLINKILDYIYGKNFYGLARNGMYNVERNILAYGIEEYIKTGKDVIDEYDEFTWQLWDKEFDYNWLISEYKIEFWQRAINKETFFNIYSFYTEEQINKLKERLNYSVSFYENKKTYKYRRKNGFHKMLKNGIKKRDNYRCVICGDNKNTEVDHIKPLIYGGNNDETNLQTLCRDCHKVKTKKDRKIWDIKNL